MLWEEKPCPALGGWKVCPQNQNSGLTLHPPFWLVLHQPKKKPEDSGGPRFGSIGIHRALQGPDRGREDTKGQTEDSHRVKDGLFNSFKASSIAQAHIARQSYHFLLQEDNLKSFFRIFEIKIYSSNLNFLFLPHYLAVLFTFLELLKEK